MGAVVNALDHFFDAIHLPTLRNGTKGRVSEGGGEQGGGGFVEAVGFAAVEFGADGVEIHEPALEQGPRRRLQCRVHPPVQLDLVVQRPKHRRDGFLLGDGGDANRDGIDEIAVKRRLRTPRIVAVEIEGF